MVCDGTSGVSCEESTDILVELKEVTWVSVYIFGGVPGLRCPKSKDTECDCVSHECSTDAPCVYDTCRPSHNGGNDLVDIVSKSLLTGEVSGHLTVRTGALKIADNDSAEIDRRLGPGLAVKHIVALMTEVGPDACVT